VDSDVRNERYREIAATMFDYVVLPLSWKKIQPQEHQFDTASTDDWIEEIKVARIAGGMHFRTSTVDGTALGKSVAEWVVTHHFQPK